MEVKEDALDVELPAEERRATIAVDPVVHVRTEMPTDCVPASAARAATDFFSAAWANEIAGTEDPFVMAAPLLI